MTHEEIKQKIANDLLVFNKQLPQDSQTFLLGYCMGLVYWTLGKECESCQDYKHETIKNRSG